MSPLLCLPTGRRRFVLLAVAAVAVCYPAFWYWYEIQTALATAARPLWSGAPSAGPPNVLAHFHAEGLYPSEETCVLHGWRHRKSVEIVQRELWDTIFLDDPTEAELDLLEIRTHALYEVVDKFFIVESNRTVNGQPKRQFFSEQRHDRFGFITFKTVYVPVPSVPATSIKFASPEDFRARQISALTSTIRSRLSNTILPPIVLSSHLDEVPAMMALRLMRDCEFPSPLHLQLRQYLYSFEWPTGLWNWRSKVVVWDEDVAARFGQEDVGDDILADAGWNCVYCYRKPEELIAKVEDSLGLDVRKVTPSQVEEAMCEGRDIFNAIPEQAVMFRSPHREPAKSAINLPKYLVEKAQKFRYLLPGGCTRVEAP